MSTLTPPGILVLDRTCELAARLRHHVAPQGAVVRACPDAGRAETHIAGGHWDVLVAGPSMMHRAGLRRLSSLHGRHPSLTILLALHERPRADLAEIIQVGASDLLPLHSDDDELRRALQRATRLTRARLGVMTDGPAGRSRGRIVMVASASGGCGKTFLATNAAEFLTRSTDQPVVLVDLDLQFGEVSTALRLRPEATIIDALAAEAEGYDLGDVLDEYLLDHPDGFKVLAAPRQPAEADSVTPGDVSRLLDVLRARGAWVVIDSHEGLSDVFRAALEATDHVFAVATPDRPSLVNLERYLGLLGQLGLSPAAVSVVLNKAEPGHGIPYSREVSRSINLGVPLIVGKPRSEISTLLAKTFAAMLPGAPKARPAPRMKIPAPVQAPQDVAEPEPAPVAAAASPAESPPPGVPATEAGAEVVITVEVDIEIDLREREGTVDPAQIGLTDPPTRRGRGPPCPLSPRPSPSLVTPLATKWSARAIRDARYSAEKRVKATVRRLVMATMRRSTQMLILGLAIFAIGAGVVLVSFMGSGKDGDKSAMPTTTTTIQAGTVLIGGPPVAPTSFTIPEGKQAVAVQLPYVNGLAGYVKAGDKVNVYGNVEKGSTTAPELVAPATKLILPSVEVLAVTGPGPGADTGNATYLLALDANQAEQAIFFAKYESLWLTLVPKGQANSQTSGHSYKNAL